MKAQDVRRIIEMCTPKMDALMDLGVSSWEELTEGQLEELNEIAIRYLGEVNIRKARNDGVITREEFQEVNAFLEWNNSLGGHDE